MLSDDRSLATRIGVTAIGHLLQLELGTVQGSENGGSVRERCGLDIADRFRPRSQEA